jgi:beta-galactosidase
MLKWVLLIIFVALLVAFTGCGQSTREQAGQQEAPEPGGRTVIDLNGTWEIAEGGMDSVPNLFERKVPVPGLVDMAKPAFQDVGKKSPRRQAFWYHRTFTLDKSVPDVAMLKIHKAKYGTKVFLNGSLIGEHLPCFTPALLDVRPFLKGAGQQNELIVRVGADRESLPEGMPTGWDFEKYLYIPGIYDSVELILAGAPYIERIQTVPDIESNKVKVVAEIENVGAAQPFDLHFRLQEASTGRNVESGAVGIADASGKQNLTVSFDIPIKDCNLWTPEDPFLYELQLATEGDDTSVRFGMRSFRFDKETGRAVLNGRTYFMRGTNVCAYRFFEDADRGDKPWRTEWVRKLHRKFKSMNWNSIRYCIGFPPDLWYDIADEEGFLIQDEFPIWLLSEAPEKPVAEKIIPEYIEWMQERWNHPCVVIWDAQNESVTEETGKATAAVRHLDLSNRPWNNGWAEPQSPNDCVEAHPYLFSRFFNPSWSRTDFNGLKDMVNVSPVPSLRDAQRKLDVPIIINEYGWLWLNRDGTPTCLTANVYKKLLGPDSTTEQRRLLYARYLAALTEFWRCGRKCAGVLHFCGLGYSRPGDKPRPEGGATSDHFIDLENLTFEPNFERYVRDAFSPVGLMIDFWAEQLDAGSQRKFDMVLINDLPVLFEGPVRLAIRRKASLTGERDGATVTEKSENCRIDGLASTVLTFEMEIPKQEGQYRLVAELIRADGTRVQSLRDFIVSKGISNGDSVGSHFTSGLHDGVPVPPSHRIRGQDGLATRGLEARDTIKEKITNE